MNGYGCHAQDRHERRVLGVASQNQPSPLWMGHGAQRHQRYRDRRKRR